VQQVAIGKSRQQRQVPKVVNYQYGLELTKRNQSYVAVMAIAGTQQAAGSSKRQAASSRQ
jgi:hypothetical protein